MIKFNAGLASWIYRPLGVKRPGTLLYPGTEGDLGITERSCKSCQGLTLQKTFKENDRMRNPLLPTTKAGSTINSHSPHSPQPPELCLSLCFTPFWGDIYKSCHLVPSLQTCPLGRAEWFTSLLEKGFIEVIPSDRKYSPKQ